MDIKDAFIQGIAEVFPLFKMRPQFQSEEAQNFLSSVDQVSILCSFSHALKGNIVFGLSKTRALKIASLVQDAEIEHLDLEAKKAIGEIVALAVNLAISKFKAVNSIDISPPVFIVGDDVMVMISRVKTTKLVFKLHEELLTVAYSIEQGSEASNY